AVLRAALLAILHRLGVENAAKHVVTHTRQIADTTTANEHDRVLLQVVTLAGDIGNDFTRSGQANLRNLAQGRIRLLRGRRVDARTDATLLRILLHRGHFAPLR